MNDPQHSREPRVSLLALVTQERRRQGPERHAEAATLVAYHAGELPDAAAEELRDHLAVCPHCAHLLLDLDRLVAPLPEPAELPAGDLVARAPLPARPALLPARRQPVADAAAQRLVRFLAAALILMTILTAAGWLPRLRSPADRPSERRFEMIRLEVPEVLRGPAEPPRPAIVHADAAVTVLAVPLAQPVPDLRFHLLLRATTTTTTTATADSEGGQAKAGAAPGAWHSLNVPALEATTELVVVTLDRGQLPPGDYVLRVEAGPETAPGPALGEYSLHVAAH